MKYLTIKFLLLLSFALFFTIQANAQLCGQYGATLYIYANDEKPIEIAVVELLPFEKDETKGKIFVRDKENPAKFKIEFLEGHIIKTKYKLLVSADGFETFQTELKFPHCERQTLKAVLKPTPLSQEMDNSSSEPITINNAQEIEVTGIVYNKNNVVIPEVNIKAINEKGKVVETETDDNGKYVLRLMSQTYKLFFVRAGFKKLIYSNFEAKSFNTKKINHNVVLGIAMDNGHYRLIIEDYEVIETTNTEIETKIFPKPIEKIVKVNENNKNKEENIINNE